MALLSIMLDEGEHLTYKEARTCKLRFKWELTMQEIKLLHANDAWDLVSLLVGRNALLNKWIYKIKTIEGKAKYKARFVAKGMHRRKVLTSKRSSLML